MSGHWVITAGSPFSAEALLALPFLQKWRRPPEHVEAATKCYKTKVSLHLEANCQIVDGGQCGRMLRTEGALTGLQSSPVERFCIFQLAPGLEAICQIVD